MDRQMDGHFRWMDSCFMEMDVLWRWMDGLDRFFFFIYREGQTFSQDGLKDDGKM